MADEQSARDRDKLRTLNGLVAAVDSEEESEEEVTLAILSDDDDERYLVRMDRKGRELLEYIDSAVEVVGTVDETTQGPVITVKSFEELDAPDEYWDNDDGWALHDEVR